MTPLRTYLNALSFTSPGADSWDALRARFDGAAAQTEWEAKPACLNPRAARRLSPQIRLAVTVAERITPSLPTDAAWVFASSIGEGETLQVILEALRTSDMMIQPLRFQNAVHNAASGQWTIAGGLTGPATSIGAYDETVGAGLLKAAMQVALERRSVGIVLYDVPLPEPLDAIHPLGVPFGVGLALSSEQSDDTIAVLEVTTSKDAPTLPLTDVSSEMIATLNPIAKVLPLLERLAGHGDEDVLIGLHGGSSLRIAVTAV